MQKPALFRAIYAELRDSLGPEVTSGELVRIASLIFQAYKADTEGIDHGQPRAGRSLASLPVDQAMRDGGWKVLEYESDGQEHLDERISQMPLSARLIVDKYLGPEWKNQSQKE